MKSNKTFFPELKQLEFQEPKEKSKPNSLRLKKFGSPVQVPNKKRVKGKKTGSLADSNQSNPKKVQSENFRDQFMMLTKYSKSSPKAWNEDQTITKYLDLIQESDEKVKLSYDVLTQKAAFELNSKESPKKREKGLLENKVLFEFPENKDFLKSFSEKQLSHLENLSKAEKIAGRKEDFNGSLKEAVRIVQKVETNEGFVKYKGKVLRNSSEKTKNGKFEVKENASSRKSAKLKNDSRTGPLILTKAESYLKKQNEKGNNKSPKNTQSSRYVSLDRKGNEFGISSPKNLVSLSEVYKTSEGLKPQKTSAIVQSPKEFSINNDFNSFPSSPAYNRVVSFRNYLNNKL